MKVLVMAGGSGSRLWPLSRSSFPKQFLNLHDGDKTMLQQTIHRVQEVSDSVPIVICNEEHRFVVAEQLRQGEIEAEILLEPVARNTAPAIALAALKELDKGSDTTILVLPADHVVEDVPAFHGQIEKALPLAENGSLVTFGIVPKTPETGYGYIQVGNENGHGYCVESFVEKPDIENAKKFLNSSKYLWNSGMFLFKASRYIEELNKHKPDIVTACRNSLDKKTTDLAFIRVDKEEFSNCPAESIDYAVMEKTDASVVVPLDAGWNDVGAWSSIWDIADKDENNNLISGDALYFETTNSLIKSTSKLVTTVGLDNVVVVETSDAILVAKKDQVQKVKQIAEKLKVLGRKEVSVHREVFRPWGKFDSIDEGNRYQVKHITVRPGNKLSVQKHHHRSEHWIVVSGTARVGRGNEEMILTENESVYIPVGCIHWLENPGKIPLELIEVQSGAYLGEDDIVRLSDVYGRS